MSNDPNQQAAQGSAILTEAQREEQARKQIQQLTDEIGQISEAEGQAFGVKLAGEVGASLELTIDGTTQPVTWSTVAVGATFAAVTVRVAVAGTPVSVPSLGVTVTSIGVPAATPEASESVSVRAPVAAVVFVTVLPTFQT